ncbi:MAG: FliM/FliN family flagellar motor switch protein [Planctomycetota bacterium]|nr:FliM/FliN family flagellar motor switch protein [Planctomycetota bacterium]
MEVVIVEVQDFVPPEAEPANEPCRERDGSRSRTSISRDVAMETLHPAGSKLAAALAKALGEQLRRPVELLFAHVQRRTFPEVLAAETVPPCLYTLEAAGQSGGWVQVSPSVFFPMLDCLLGGDGTRAGGPERAMTYVERQLGRRIVERIAQAVQQELGGPEGLIPRSGETPQPPPPGQPFLEISFAVRLGEQAGMLRVAMDPRSVGSLPLPEGGRPLGIMELTVTSLETPVPAEELTALAPGDILATEIDANQDVVVRLAGIPKFVARLGSYEGRRAVTITGPVT